MNLANLITDPELRREIAQEKRNRRKVVIDPIYLSMCQGDMYAAAMLADIIYWHMPNKQGKTKLRVNKDNRLWIAKKNEEWADDLGITVSQVRRVKKLLEDLHLIINKVFKFNGLPTGHISLNQAGFSVLFRKHMDTWERGFVKNEKVVDQPAATELESNCVLAQKEMSLSAEGNEPERSSLTENTTENTTESIKTPKPPEGALPEVKIPASYSPSYKIQGVDYETQPDNPLPFLKWGRKKIYLPRRMPQKFIDWITQYPETGGTYLDAAKTWDAKARSKMLTEQTADECLSNILAKKQSDSGWLRGAVPHPKTYLNGKHWEIGPVQNDFPAKGKFAPKSNLSVFDEIIAEQQREQDLNNGF